MMVMVMMAMASVVAMFTPAGVGRAAVSSGSCLRLFVMIFVPNIRFRADIRPSSVSIYICYGIIWLLAHPHVSSQTTEDTPLCCIIWPKLRVHLIKKDDTFFIYI